MKAKENSDKVLYRFDTNPENPILGCIPHLKVAIL